MNSVLEQIRNAKPETREFPYKVGEETFSITAKRFAPGVTMQLQKKALIRLYRQVKQESILLADMSEEELQENMAARDERLAKLNESFCQAVVDDDGQNYVSIQDSEELFTVEFKQEVVDWAMMGESPVGEDNPDEVDLFRDRNTDGSEEPDG